MANTIKNKIKRREIHAKEKRQKISERHTLRHERAKLEDNDPELAKKRLSANVPATLESKRVYDETVETAPEGIEDDDFKAYFESGKTPKVLITTSKHSRDEAFDFIDCLLESIPNCVYVKRGTKFSMKEISSFAASRDFTDLIVVNEDKKRVNGLTFIHLPEGPTMYFSVSSIIMPKQISGHGTSTGHTPELILNNFTTRLGHTVGRLFQSLFPQSPEFVGRQVVTLHNQRDYIFFRRHRYIFRNEEKVGLQELGPQFTLKLRRVQKGIRDQLEWQHEAGMDKDKRKFYL